ncbi:hypothetical protein [Aestuariirhabdus sp. LZHN29]|uniref:hypothetical protein n=1 Tax=Aestuariirhabdus sp. LZHN29 TaxID=3417462 RepID=UPI003CF97F9A
MSYSTVKQFTPSPAAHCQQFLHETPGGFKYYIALPKTVDERTRILVSVHGISRNASEHLEAFARNIDTDNCAILCPLFSAENFPGYQRLGIARKRHSARPDLALHSMLEHATQRYGVSSQRFDLFGFSGGAQFAHRYALLHPHRLRRLALAAAGYYTFPDHQQEFPRGLQQKRVRQPVRWQLEASLCIPMALFVGTLDNERDESLRQGPLIDAQQGVHRTERAERWVAATRQAISKRGLTTPVTLTMLADCGHDFTQCIAEGKLDQELRSFLNRPLSAAVSAPIPQAHPREMLQFMR